MNVDENQEVDGVATRVSTHDQLQAEVTHRHAAARSAMAAAGFSALLVYGDNKLYGNLRYLSGIFPDRAGWVSLTSNTRYVFEGALVLLPLDGEPSLLLEPGLTIAQEPCIADVRAGSLKSSPDQGLTPRSLVNLVAERVPSGVIGIETWDRFPTGLYTALIDQLKGVTLTPSTIVEDLRLIKSDYEVNILRQCAAVGDRGHEVVIEALTSGESISEQDLVRAAEYAMRLLDPIYEDSCSCSPSMICSGPAIGNSLLYPAQPDRRIGRGSMVHWDLTMRHQGYAVDTSRTRVVGRATAGQNRAFDVVSHVADEVMKAIRPGVKASQLADLAASVASDGGYELWERFLGHGLGIDSHERPDMGVEPAALAANMVLAIEPRIVEQGLIVGYENMVLVTPSGSENLNRFPAGPLELH
jgi:Xaa-Pro aminopeptidase